MKKGYIFVAFHIHDNMWHASNPCENKDSAYRDWLDAFDYGENSCDYEGYFIEVDITPPKMADEHSVNLNNYMVVKAH